jgi:hypothetical protein
MNKSSKDWSIDDVALRFGDAAQTAKRLPRGHAQGHFNMWRSLEMQIQTRYPDTERLYRPLPPTAIAIAQMLETMKWIQWLEVEQRHLVWMRAERYDWHQIGRRFACDRTTAWRRWQRALTVVTDKLNTVRGESG